MNILIDTNVISYIIKEDSRAEYFLELMQGHQHFISFMTVAELLLWAERRNWGARRSKQLEKTLQTDYHIIPFEFALARKWSDVMAETYRKGVPMLTADAWIAATACYHSMPLLTHNRKDFENVTQLVLLEDG